MGAASNGRGSNSESGDDDDGSSSLGPNFESNFDGADNDGEGNQANHDGSNMNLNQAASGYPAQGDYSGDAVIGLGFGGSGYTSADAEFGPNENFGSDGRRSKSASSPRGFEDDAGASQYGPNSAINSGGDDDDRASYNPESDNENDDE